MTGLHGQEKFYELADEIIKKCDDAACEIVFSHSADNLTRLANSVIHQNISKESTDVAIRVSRGEKFGVATTNVISPEGLFHVYAQLVNMSVTSDNITSSGQEYIDILSLV